MIGVGFDTKTVIFDFEDLDNPKFHMNYFGPTAAADHNGYVKGDTFYLANYRAGVRVIDISDIANKNIEEIGSFDTFPTSNSATFSGVWSVYPYFDSGTIILSDIQRGLMVIKSSNVLSTNEFKHPNGFSIFPNPYIPGTQLNLSASQGTEIEKVVLFNLLGEKVVDTNLGASRETSLTLPDLSPGIYLVEVNDSFVQKLLVN